MALHNTLGKYCILLIKKKTKTKQKVSQSFYEKEKKNIPETNTRHTIFLYIFLATINVNHVETF